MALGVRLAPNRVQPDWPHAAPQQVHIDLHAQDFKQAHERAMALLLQSHDPESEQGNQVCADPAGHPFCVDWGQPAHGALPPFVRERLPSPSQST